MPLLGFEHWHRVVERRLDHRDDVKRVRGRIRVEQVERGDKERGQRLVEREIIRHVDVKHVIRGVVVTWNGLDEMLVKHRAEDVVRQLVQMRFLLVGLRGVVDELVDAGTGVTALGDLVEHHRMRDFQMRDQSLGGRFDKLVEGVLVPCDEALRRLLALDFLEFLRIITGFGQLMRVLDLILRSLGDHQPFGIEAHAAGTTGNLVEFAGAQTTGLNTVEFRQRGEHHGMNRHVDADAQGIGTANHRKQALLGELFNQSAVSREHAGMMHADTGAQQALQNLAERRSELRALHRLGDGVTLLLGGDIAVGERLRGGQCGILREVDDVNRGVAVADQQLDSRRQRLVGVFVGQRDRTRGVGDDVDVRVGGVFKPIGNRIDVAERCAHEQELRVRQCNQRNLPRPSTLSIAVIVEFVHRHTADIRLIAFPERLVREDFRRAADDWRVGVDMRVTGDHADVVPAEHLDKVEELLGDERLDRRGVVGAAAGAQRGEMHAERDQRFAGAGRGVEDHVVARKQVHDSLFLVGPRGDALGVLHPAEEAIENRVGVEVASLAVVRGQHPERPVSIRPVGL